MIAKLVSTENLNSRVKLLEFVVQNGLAFEFQPGQFVTLSIADGDSVIERSYSIASSKNQKNTFELCVSLNPFGKATPLLWDMKVGTEVNYNGPHGSFILREAEGLEHVFVCTGTGVAPFRSMIRELESKGFLYPVYLIFGNRKQADILFRGEFDALAHQYPNFHFIPVLSQENWDGETGYVHEVYEKLFSDGRDARFYVCGWQEMCTEARNRLKALGYNRRQYFFEDYG